MTELTLEQVAWKLGELAREGAVRYDAHDMAVMCSQMADAVTANLSQPQPVAQGEAVAYRYRHPDEEGKWMVFQSRARSEALAESGLVVEPLYATPTIPTGHRVVADGLAKDAARYQWLRDRVCVRWEMALDGEKHEALGMRPGFGFLRSTMDPAKGWTLPEFFDDHRQKTDNAIDKAMLAAAPDAGGV